jgi:hypothetical protein
VLTTQKGHPLPKEGICYQQVVGQREVQHILSLLVPTIIPKPPMHSLETSIRHTHMAIGVSSYEELLPDGHGTNHAIQVFPKLPLDALTKTYLWGIGTEFNQVALLWRLYEDGSDRVDYIEYLCLCKRKKTEYRSHKATEDY